MYPDHPLLWALLLMEIVALCGVGALYLLAAGGRSVARRVDRHVAQNVRVATTPRVKKVNVLTRLIMADLDQQRRDAVPWLLENVSPHAAGHLGLFATGRVLFALFIGGVGYAFFNFLLMQWDVPPAVLKVLGGASAAGGYWMVRTLLVATARERWNRISSGMPYALDLILICLDSGTALETAIARVADELSQRDPLVAQELRRTLLDINVIGNREVAFRNLGERVGTPNMRSIVGVLCQSLQYGSSLSIALKGAIENMKRTELIALEERAGKLPVQLTIPGLLFTFPQVIVLLAGPGVLDLLDTFTSTQ